MLKRRAAILAILAAAILTATAAMLPPAIAQVTPISAARLAGAWSIVSYHDGAAMVSSADVFGKPGIIIFRDGQLDGTPGCGSLIGHYSIIDGAIAIHAGTLLTGNCYVQRDGRAVNLLDDSERVTHALNRVHAVKANGDDLVLHAADGTVVAMLAPRSQP